MARHIFIILLFGIISATANAQQQPVFSPLNSNDGLSEDGVRSITQLPDGRMVILTDGLVNLYDGVSFRYLHLHDGHVYPLTGYQSYHRSYTNSPGELWIKDYLRLLLYDIKKERFVTNLDSVLARQGVHVPLSNFFIDDECNFWYLTEEDNLLFRDQNESKATLFIPKVSSLGAVNDKLKEVATYENKLFLFYRSGLMICYGKESRKELFRENPLTKKFDAGENQIIFVTRYEHYLYEIYNDLGGNVLRYDIKERKWETVMKQDYWLNTLSLDKSGNIWLSSSVGLWYINKNLQERQHISDLPLIDGKVWNTPVNALFSDNLGGIWIGTAKRGLLYYHPDRFKFRNIDRSFFDLSPNESLKVNCFIDKGKEILVGTTAGLFVYSREKRSVHRYAQFPHKFEIFSFSKDYKQRIWVCCGGNGLYCIENENVRYYDFPNEKIYRIYENNDKTLYLCMRHGFGIFDPETKKFEPFKNTESMNVVYQLVEWDRNKLLGLSDMGIFTYDRKTGKVQLTGTYEKKRPPFFRQNNYRYDCVYTDSRGLNWIGSRDGLSVWDKKENKLKLFHTEDGLINNRIQSITEDYHGNIWVATSNGLSRIGVEKRDNSIYYKFSNFNRFDGVIANEFYERSVFRTPSGLLYWGGIDGFNEADPERINTTHNAMPTPLFSRIYLFGTEIKQGKEYQGNVILEQSVSATKELLLHHNQNFITFEFSALNYINPSQTYYRVQLIGVDEHIQEIAAVNGIGKAIYTNLAPGSYTLRVQSGNNNEEWSEKFAEMRITIKPPFWKTAWAYTLYGLLFVCLFFSATTYYLRWSKKKMQQQQKEDLEKMKYRFFTNISHELRTPLTLILTPLDSLIKKVEDAYVKTQLTGIYRNASDLLSVVNQLLDFRKVEMGGEMLQLSYGDIGEFVNTICTSFVQFTQNKKIAFVFENNTHNLYAYVDNDKLRKILNNLISNACKFTPENGQITVRLSRDEQNKYFTLQVTDTGIGIPEKEIPHIFTRFYQVSDPEKMNTGSGIGLHLVQEYVHMHNGKITVTGESGKGSSFTLEIPLDLRPEYKIENEPDCTTAHPGTKPKLLIVEDNDEFRSFLSHQLEELYIVESAEDGEEGLRKALELLPDLIISDIMMPKMDGIELCKLLKKEMKTSHTPVILLTARTSEESQLEGYGSGADAYISKPFNMDLLLLRIANLLEQMKQRKELFRKAIVIQPASITSTSLDEKLISTALKCIENNFNNPNYSVELLAKDMNMDRTGLYRKLVAIVGQSPTLFIRSIRLKKSAQLLNQGYTVSEVAEKVGFGTIGYFSKCFQEEFGVKPSQYAKKETGSI